MARPRTLPDSDVFAAILHRIATEGEKAVSFASIARATGLAGASLVQRYGGLPQMVEQALVWGWDQLDARATAAEVAAHDKGPQALLKALGEGGPTCRSRPRRWPPRRWLRCQWQPCRWPPCQWLRC